MAVKIDIPIQLQVDAQLLRAGSSAVIAARLAEAIKQGLEFMAEQVAADGHFGQPVFEEPRLHWTGPGVSSVSAADRARTEARLRQAVQQTCHAFAASSRPRRQTAVPARVVLDHPATFRTTPRKFLALLDLRRTERRDDESRYHDELDVPHDGVAFRVQTHDMMTLDELHPELVRALDRELHGDDYQYDVALSREDVTRFVQLDRVSLAGPLATAYVTPVSGAGDAVIVAPHSQLFVAVLRLPQVKPDARILRGPVTQVEVHLRDLDPLIQRDWFLRVTGVSWNDYSAEWGGDPIDVTIYPFTVRRRTHGKTLEVLLEDEARSEAEGFQLGGLSLLTRNAVSELPALHLSSFTDQVTRGLPDSAVNGTWELGWSGAYLSARLRNIGFKVAAARHRPEAGRLARQIVEVLTRRDPQHHELRNLIVGTYGESAAAMKNSAEAFGFLLDVLEELPPARTWLTRLYDASRLHDCQELLVQLAYGTRYANHPAVTNAAARVAAKHAKAFNHFYVPGTGVHIHRKWMWLYGEVLGDDNELYLIKSKITRLKKSSEARLGNLLLDAARTVIQRMVAGGTSRTAPARSPWLGSAGAVTSTATAAATAGAVATTRSVKPLEPELTREEFAQAVLEEVQSHITAEDLEEVEVLRSIRLLGVHDDDDRGVTRHWVKFAWVENVAGEGWQTLRRPDGREALEESVVSDPGGLEELLFLWEFRTSAVVAQVELKLVGYAIAIFGAVELGAFELVPQAPGFIAFNVIVYLGKAAFFGGEFSLDGLMLEAVKGYAMALGFQLFAPIGRFLGTWVAAKIGANTIARYLGGLLVQRLVSGGIAGAGTGALTRFATDLVEIAMGVRQGFSGWREYLGAMGEGAIVGIAFELGSDVFRALGKTDSFRAFAAAARRARWSPTRWWTEIGASQARLRQWLTEVASEVRTLDVEGLIQAFREKFTDLAESIAEGTRQAMLRRTLVLARVELNALSASGLDRLLETLDASAAEALLRELVKDAATAARFLELLGALDERLVAMLANRGQLAVLAGSPRMLAVLSTQGRLGLGLLDAFSLDVAAAERFLIEADQVPAGVRGRGLQLFDGPLAQVPGLAGRLVRKLGTRLLTTVAPEGSMVRIAGELTIAPTRLAEFPEDELTRLLDALEHPGDPASQAALEKLESNPSRFRFRSRVATKIDPWIATTLQEAGFPPGSPQYQLLQRMSDAQKERLWDLPTNRGTDPNIRPQAARWALNRQHTSVADFAADFQFYVGEEAAYEREIAQALARQVAAEIRAAEAAAGGVPLRSAQRDAIARTVLARPRAPAGQPINSGGLGVPDLINTTGGGARAAIRELAVSRMQAEGPGRVTAAYSEQLSHLSGEYRTGTVQLDRVETARLGADLAAHADQLSFAEPAEAAYHAHVHESEIPEGSGAGGANEVQRYLNKARQTIREGTASAPRLMQYGNWSVTFSLERGDVIVSVTAEGRANITTFMPAKRKR